MNPQVLLNRVGQEQAKGYCTHPEASQTTCSGKPTAAHTIQKEGGLRAIAENGHVMSIKRASLDLIKNEGSLVPGKDGIGRTSTFPGFCNAHDGMFAAAEGAVVPLDDRTAFLLSYRSVAYERLMKEAALRANEANRRDGDLGKPFEDQARIQTALHGEKLQIEASLRDIASIQARFNAVFKDPSLSGFSYLIVEFDRVLPVVSSGALFPEVDMFGDRLQSLDSWKALDALAVNFTVLNGRSVLVLGWLTGTKAPEAFAASFARLPDDDKANTSARFAMEWIENTYATPTWWTGLPVEVKRTALASARTLDAPPVCQRDSGGYCSDGIQLVAAAVVRVVGPRAC